MKTYAVGGAVRDELLGLPVKEKDYVVVGATPEEMQAKGFKPVGKDFPVFLHPETHEEYALARTERKSGRGYKGFKVYTSPSVTLEDDLRRRDLTINAIAKDEETGELIDPYGGQRDLKRRLLRHVSDAFAEDPVRILRVARFAARFNFKVAPETMMLMKRMVSSGETDFLVPERAWQELSKGLSEKHVERMFQVLKETGLRDKLLPHVKTPRKALSGSVAVRFARLAWRLTGPQISVLCEHLRLPSEIRELALLASRLRTSFIKANNAKPKELLKLFKRADALRRPERFHQLLEVARLSDPRIKSKRIIRALNAASSVKGGPISKAARSRADIPKLIDEARVRAIADAE
ncbi:MAG TPA: multifunctional CCA tRNA nucleotidyl transferase/2'3'-cyclic phosphodiesterase/2'nucleotidase/phosphatase [Burkholderiales bacterium]|nr:multifunctional CCA tRNA nucleotidyl transferase/2'3'-cyclic phosphodiesterase/2'nucleotidase/phosphatase [Burkholderiales bacterium]